MLIVEPFCRKLLPGFGHGLHTDAPHIIFIPFFYVSKTKLQGSPSLTNTNNSQYTILYEIISPVTCSVENVTGHWTHKCCFIAKGVLILFEKWTYVGQYTDLVWYASGLNLCIWFIVFQTRWLYYAVTAGCRNCNFLGNFSLFKKIKSH